MKKKLIIFSSLFFISATQAKVLNYKTSCPSQSGYYTLGINSEISLVESLAQVTEDLEKKSIEMQIQFIKTDLKNRMQAKLIDIVFTDEDVEYQVNKRSKGKLAQNFSIKKVTHADVTLTSEYLLNAIAKTKLSTKEVVQSFQYTAKVGVIVCSESNKQAAKTIETNIVKAPRDPWLAHWMTGDEHLYEVKWNASEFRIPSYFNSEYADIPHPEFAWYFWNPEYSGKTKLGKKYSATKDLRHSKSIVTAKVKVSNFVELESTSQLVSTLNETGKKAISVTIVFGITDPKLEQVDFNAIFQIAQSGKIDKWQSLVLEKLKDLSEQKEVDRGSLYAASFLNNLHRFLQMDEYNFTFDKEEKILTIHSKLKESGVDIRINFFFGSTDVLAGMSPNHWNASLQGLINDDIIFYIGHSGLGENFKVANILSNSKTDKTEIQKKKRIIGIFSCYSASYFERDLSEILSSNSLLILTGSSYTSARGPIGILNWVDSSVKVNQPVAIPHIVAEDFLIFKELI